MRIAIAALALVLTSCGIEGAANDVLPNDGWLRCEDAHPLWCGYRVSTCCAEDYPYYCDEAVPVCARDPGRCSVPVIVCERDIQIQF